MKKSTYEKRAKIANDVMNYIYKYIDTNINIDELSLQLNISKFHLHRVFKEEFGKNIYESIKSIRLEKAANLLISNKFSTISNISSMIGYSSQTSFIRSFKQRFNIVVIAQIILSA
ncbi:MAG TPA: helix-turn-helix transcriptional regulator, partial [Aliarcobacter cryaerophilus]|nr:helix-turn-helix transcriptional regulator [Aliarcobacter cryaerophilus]